MLLERFSTVQAVLAACSDVAKGKNDFFFFTKTYLFLPLYNCFSMNVLSVLSAEEALFVLQLGAKIHRLCNQGR